MYNNNQNQPQQNFAKIGDAVDLKSVVNNPISAVSALETIFDMVEYRRVHGN